MDLWQIDAFTDRAFAGNPAAVCFLDKPRPDAWMQALAAEMNLSETAFLLPGFSKGYSQAINIHTGTSKPVSSTLDAISNASATSSPPSEWRLRWFTPQTEVKLCGHATLAAAHALLEGDLIEASQSIVFETLSGTLQAQRSGKWIDLNFPTDVPQALAGPQSIESIQLLAEALGEQPRSVTRGQLYFLVELADAEAIRSLQPDMEALRRLRDGVCVTARSDDDAYDFVSRFFAPGLGIDEDPVTGSAHCVLAPYWARKLKKTELVGYQASARGGVVRVALAGDRVRLSGQAVTVFRGKLTT